jgi:uncharacterized membrane protein
MHTVSRHLTRCFFAGVVALLPVAGLVLSVVYVENTLAESWLAKQPYYFPGLGLLAAGALIYAIGLVVSTFIGRWLWGRVDSAFDRLPGLGPIYRTLKQILGYGEGKDALFQGAVLVPGASPGSEELGLVTNEVTDSDGRRRVVVFVPAAPNPAVGRLVLVDSARVRPLGLNVNEALKGLVSLGKTPISGERPVRAALSPTDLA